MPSRDGDKVEELDFLRRRQSVPARLLGEPGPTDEQLEALLQTALRVPDHGRLAPWRLLKITGEARARLGEAIAKIHRRNEPDAPEAVLDKDRGRFVQAPLVIAVVVRIDPDHRIPAQEQLLSSGLVAYNLLLGAQALGFGAQWLTGWAAYDREVASLLGLAGNEHITAFVHIGTARSEPEDRARPPLADHLSDWN